MDKGSSKVAKKQIAKLNAYKAVFAGPQGALVIQDLMASHGMMAATYRGNVNDMLIKEGERNVILRILGILNTNVQELRERIEAHEKSLAD